jgi:hypothetical protein
MASVKGRFNIGNSDEHHLRRASRGQRPSQSSLPELRAGVAQGLDVEFATVKVVLCFDLVRTRGLLRLSLERFGLEIRGTAATSGAYQRLRRAA